MFQVRVMAAISHHPRSLIEHRAFVGFSLARVTMHLSVLVEVVGIEDNPCQEEEHNGTHGRVEDDLLWRAHNTSLSEVTGVM